MKTTIEDIAKRANVSKSAVSIALNGKSGISEETRTRILRIVNESGYIPRSMVRAGQIYPATKTFRFVACTNLGIVTNQYVNLPFFTELIHYIEEHSRTHGYSIVFSSIQSDEFDVEVERVEKEAPSQGIILLGTNLSESQIRNIARYQPSLVVVDTAYEKLNVNFVVMNNFMGAYQAGRYLLDSGHINIGYVQSNSRMFNFDERKRGFLAALDDANVSVKAQHFISATPTMVSSQRAVLESLNDLGNDMPTAFFCECDYIAISVMKSLQELGYKIPDEVSIIGFDNISEAQIVTPELTTIHVEKEKIARTAVQTLLNVVEEKDFTTSKAVIDTKLVERDSCNVPHNRP